MIDPFLGINKVFSLVIQEERQREVALSYSNNLAMPIETSVALVSKIDVNSQGAVNKQPNFHRERPTCTHRGLLGHVVEKCYKIHGYSLGYISGYKSNRTRIAAGPHGHSCNPHGHSCNPYGHSAHKVQEFLENNYAHSLAITSEQCKQLLALIQPFATNPASPQVSHSPSIFATLNLHPISTAINTILSHVARFESYTPLIVLEPNLTSESSSAISPATANSPASLFATPSPALNPQIDLNSSLLTVPLTPTPTYILHHPMTTRVQDGTRKPKPFPNYKLYFSTKHPLMALHSQSPSYDLSLTPTKYSEAAQSSHWQQAMQDEFTALQANQT